MKSTCTEMSRNSDMDVSLWLTHHDHESACVSTDSCCNIVIILKTGLCCRTGTMWNITAMNGNQEPVEGHCLLLAGGPWDTGTAGRIDRGCHVETEWQKDVSSSLCCNLPIISNFQDKQSHVRMGGGQVQQKHCAYILQHICIPYLLRSSKIHSKSRSWLTSNSTRYKSNQNEKKI